LSGSRWSAELYLSIGRFSYGSTYTLNVTFGTCGGTFPGAGEAWIDWNQNLTFEPGESIGTWSGSPNLKVQPYSTVSSLSRFLQEPTLAQPE
jgi:hypothetical protein